MSDVVVLIDREQGGRAHLDKHGLKLHAAFTLSFIVDTLLAHKLLSSEVVNAVKTFIAENQTTAAVAGALRRPIQRAPGMLRRKKVPEPQVCHGAGASKTAAPAKRLTYEARAELAQNAMGRRCFELMARKRTNLSVAVDVATADEMLRIAEQVGPHVCVLKTHVDIFDKWDRAVIEQLEALAEKHDFLIFEDRKFADIGNTVASQYGGGIYKIAEWSHITNAHLVPGTGIIDGLRLVGGPKGRGLLLLAEMSSKGTLAQGAYTEAVVKAADANTVRCACLSCAARLQTFAKRLRKRLCRTL